MVGWHHQLNGHEFEQSPGDGKGWGSPACCSPWGRKESDRTERLNKNNLSCILSHLGEEASPGLAPSLVHQAVVPAHLPRVLSTSLFLVPPPWSRPHVTCCPDHWEARPRSHAR